MVFHVPTFFKELEVLEKKGLKRVYDRIFVSDRVTIDLDLHIAVDGLEEVSTRYFICPILSLLQHISSLSSDYYSTRYCSETCRIFQ